MLLYLFVLHLVGLCLYKIVNVVSLHDRLIRLNQLIHTL